MNFGMYDIDNEPVAFTPPSGVKHGCFPYLSNKELYIRMEPFVKHQNTEGQCRFLNYGYYYDGKNIQVDKVINFNNIGDNIGEFFKEFKINIKCNKSLYDANSQNVHYRKNSDVKTKDWWFEGERGKLINDIIEKKFNFLSGLIEL